jgi:hypothetical protein
MRDYERLLFLNLMFVLLAVGNAISQGCYSGAMGNNYATYTNHSVDDTYIYTSVLVAGNASCTQMTCSACNGGTHTPQAYNSLGGVGGWGSGSSVVWNGYLNYSNDQQLLAEPGVDYHWVHQGRVICSFLGAYWASVNIDDIVRFTIWNGIYNGPNGDLCTYYLYCPNGNTNASCPDPNPRYLRASACYDYLIEYGSKLNGECIEAGLARTSGTPSDCR